MLKLRVLSGAAFIVVCLACLWAGGIAYMAMITVFALLCVRELCRLFALKGYAPATMLITASVLVMDVLAGLMGPTYMAPLFTFSAIAILVWLLTRIRPRAGIADIATSWFALIYIGFLPCHLILVRNLPEPYGFQFSVLLNTCIWATDIFAYFGGRWLGRTKLLEAVSPKKTIEGSLTGTVCAGALGALWASIFAFPWVHGLALGLIVSIVAQIGDLTESLLKRDAGTKDSGTAIPGHGGMLDRLDSYLLTGAAVYYYLRWVYHPWLP
ncbi:MAG: phosphatidate cytidylyltransferase [Candidatus Sericytochromatia bacterium]|nr:phosphatidate cytidylyltransferase [Candidatus Sericytochromatia bacterium]